MLGSSSWSRTRDSHSRNHGFESHTEYERRIACGIAGDIFFAFAKNNNSYFFVTIINFIIFALGKYIYTE